MTLQLLAPYVIACQSTVVWNPAAFPTATITLTENVTWGDPVPLEPGATYFLSIVQDATGSRLITWSALFKWPGGTPPTLTTTADATDIIALITDGAFLYGVPQYNFS